MANKTQFINAVRDSVTQWYEIQARLEALQDQYQQMGYAATLTDQDIYRAIEALAVLAPKDEAGNYLPNPVDPLDLTSFKAGMTALAALQTWLGQPGRTAAVYPLKR